MLQHKRVFVSGGAGVIGTELIPKLHALGAIVLVGDLKPRPASFPAEVRYRQGDLNYIEKRELEDFAPEIFIHLAATFERSTETYGFWEENFAHNVRLSNYLMTLLKDIASLRRVVFASSYLIYDPRLYSFDQPQLPRPLREDDPILPRNLTGMAKLAHEIELRFLNGFRQEQFTTVCPRIYRGYGRNSRDVISRWVRSLLAGEEIVIYRPEGRFDYIYAAETAEGLLRLADRPDVTGIVNLGNGRARQVSEVVAILRQYFPDMKARVEESDIPFEASEADMTLYQQQIGWIPEMQLEDAIPQIIEFERQRQAEYVSLNFGNVLVTSISKKISLLKAVRQAARQLHSSIQLFGGDANEQAFGRHFVDEFWLMPATRDESLPAIIDYCETNDIRYIIPTRDGELLFWSRYKATLRQLGISVMVSDDAAVQTCLDKLRFSEQGEAGGWAVIPAYANVADCPGNKFVVKERWGAGSQNIGLNLDREQAEAHAARLSEPIFQPYVTGNEISVDAYISEQKQVHGLVLRRRDVVQNGESQVTTTFGDEALETKLRTVLEQMHLYGHVVLQAFVDADGQLSLIECNSRFGGASSLSIAAGLDSFYWFLLEANGVSLTDYPFIRSRTELQQVRYPTDLVLAV